MYSASTLNINNGKFTALSAKSIFTDYYDGINVTIGNNDGTVKNAPTFNVPNAHINLDNKETKFNYFDGTFILNEKMKLVSNTPDRYKVCYANTNDGKIYAELKTRCEDTAINEDNTKNNNDDKANSDNEEGNNTVGSDEVENPNTGSYINPFIIIIGIASVGFIMYYCKKKNMFRNLNK